MKRTISFPQMGNYRVPAKFLFSHILKCKILEPSAITKNTIEIGSKYSPDFVCTPFKYTLGTLIEDLDNGADTVVQFGGGCRYGYYFELQEQILRDLEYNFQYINLVTEGRTDIKKIYKDLKSIDKKFNPIKALYYLLITKNIVKYMDTVDDYIRHNIGFSDFKRMQKLNSKMLYEFETAKGYFDVKRIYKKYFEKIKAIPVNKPDNCLKVGIIGELYTIMEPFANYFLEDELAKHNIEITRFTNAHYLLFEKHKKIKQYLKNTPQITYTMGADASDNIGRTLEMCKEGYDGIIHIKSTFCTPEIGAMPIINQICKEYKVPIIFFSFDANTSETGIKTRLEAFYDMLEMRKKL